MIYKLEETLENRIYIYDLYIVYIYNNLKIWCRYNI